MWARRAPFDFAIVMAKPIELYLAGVVIVLDLATLAGGAVKLFRFSGAEGHEAEEG